MSTSRIGFKPPPLALGDVSKAPDVLMSLGAVTQALDKSQRAIGTASLLAGAGRLAPGLTRGGVPGEVLDLLRLFGAVSTRNPSISDRVARQRFASDLPPIAHALTNLAGAGQPEGLRAAEALVGPLARSYDLWASQFNPLMGQATVRGFVQDLVSDQLPGNALVKDLSQRMGALLDGGSMRALESSGVDKLLEAELLGRGLSETFGQFPLDFSPFRTLSQDIREQIPTWAEAIPQTIDDLRGVVGGGQGELRDLERRGASVISDIESFVDNPLGRFAEEGSELLSDVESFVRDPLERLERRGQKALSDLEDLARDPVKNLSKHLPADVELFDERVEARATAFEAEGSVGDPDGAFYAEGRVVAGEISASAEGRAVADLSRLNLLLEGRAEVAATALAAEGAFRLGGSEYLNVAGAGQVHVGASAAAQGSLAFSPAQGNIGVNVGGEAYAGARARGEIRGTAGPVAGGIGGEAIVGVGVNAGLKAGLRDGKLSFGIDLGIALGIGLRLKLDFAIDFKKVSKLVKDGVKWLSDNIPGAKAVVDGVNKAVKWVGNAAKAIGKGVEKAASAVKDVGKAVGNAAKKVGGAVKKFFKGW